MEDEADQSPNWQRRKKRKGRAAAYMINTELGAVLAVIRRPLDPTAPFFSHEESTDTNLIQSLKSLRAYIFNPHQDWETIDPSIYISPFLDVIQSDEVPAAATAVSLSAITKILKLEIFDEKTPGARDAINSIVVGITSCRLERTDPSFEEGVMLRILQALAATMIHRACFLLTDSAACTLVNTCFQVVQQAGSFSDMLRRGARLLMTEITMVIFARLSEDVVRPKLEPESDTEDGEHEKGFGVNSAVEIFQFLCSMLNVVQVVETEGTMCHTSDEDIQLFSLSLMNQAIELSGDAIGKHPRFLRMIQDDLFHHLVHYGMFSTPLVLSMISSAVLNVYHFLRSFIRLQLEAFFEFVLLRIASGTQSVQLQEVALEGIINFCRQPTFIIEAYVNYDCDPICQNLFELIGKLLCKLSFPVAGRLTTIQMQAFEGLLNMVHILADNVDKEGGSTPFGPYPIEIPEYRPYWEEKPKEDLDTWIEYLRVRKAQKKKMAIAGDNFNRDDKKGLEYLKHSKLVSDPEDPKAYAMFFRFTPGLDKNMIGDYLGDPDDFHIQVLKEFTISFRFSGMILDTALRTYLATFRLPGEAQKIQRILEAFSEQFYDQQSSDIFATKDAVYILCYSLIMLNTDQHNPQVKKKMTEDEFIRNNRQINDGQDLPREYLSELFQSIATNAITVFGQSGLPVELTPGKWIDLTNRSKIVQPLVACEFDCRLGRDMFACIAGPLVAALSAFFDQATEDEMFHECIEGLISVARISQYGLQDVLDELIASFSKFTTLLNPYATTDEILFSFSNDLKARMATLAIFTVANSFGNSVRGGWRNIVDCLLKLKRLKLVPQNVVEFDDTTASSSDESKHKRNDSSGGAFFSEDLKQCSQHNSGLISRFSHFLSVDSLEDSISLGLNEFEQNLKIIKQCRIGSIFRNSTNLPEDALLNLGRSLIFAAGGKGQKFSTPIEEEETVGFCWDLVTIIALANIDRFQNFWPTFHDFMLEVAHFPLFSPIPFAERAIEGLFRVCVKILSSFRIERQPEELIFRSINLMWNLDKEILDTCCEVITKAVNKMLVEYPANLQSHLGWKSVLHLLSISGRLSQTYDQGVETVIVMLSSTDHISRTNYAYCIDCAFSFISLKNRPLEKSLKILDLLADSVHLLVKWYREYSDSGSNCSVASNSSGSSLDYASANLSMNLFLKLGEAFRKTSLSRREEIRNHAVLSLQRSFTLAEELDFSPANCISCFNLVIFAMVDDLHEKMVEYSRRENAERETRSMEGTLKLALEFLTDVYLQFLKQITLSPGYRTFWLGFLRRMDTCMKANLGPLGKTNLQDVIPELLKKIITKMKEEEILVPTSDDDLWEVTYIQIQWIAPSLKGELFPELET
ncbi:Nucleolar GTP-binding protein 2 [Turnera subulata]|uniref:Nucleolar GTP-binding protein 2 n=1 Tax=Turnera subulata TaxID=218843 RepID=A0A9Q0JMR9_9ROSI|nr:Nucleolar GTP-binding protein 2 [Turnera subulata]